MSVRQRLEEIKSEILEKFVAEMMTELLRQGFTFADMLDALATWSENTQPDEVTRCLEELVKATKEVG